MHAMLLPIPFRKSVTIISWTTISWMAVRLSTMTRRARLVWKWIRVGFGCLKVVSATQAVFLGRNMKPSNGTIIPSLVEGHPTWTNSSWIPPVIFEPSCVASPTCAMVRPSPPMRMCVNMIWPIRPNPTISPMDGPITAAYKVDAAVGPNVWDFHGPRMKTPMLTSTRAMRSSIFLSEPCSTREPSRTSPVLPCVDVSRPCRLSRMPIAARWM
mmetsp:Transcript_22880/g.52993  ORF Transcript_22880/g.52993 Transcript_22880/m.52993 type:complete len:213 (-) Transcript_22880:874-1512(-)